MAAPGPEPEPKRRRMLEAPDSDDDELPVARAGPPPTGAAGRVARASLAFLKLTAGGLFGLGPGPEARARAFTDELACLRGVYTKVGQVAAAFLTASGTEPGSLKHHLAEHMAQLQHRVVPMNPAELIAEMTRTWGVADVLEVLEEPPQIIAAASIGQVFRGRLKRDGKAVAIKVQYPGIAQAMRDDLASIDAIISMMTRALSFKVNPAAVADEIRLLIGGEIEYALERRVQHAFHEFWKGHPTIAVPGVVDDLCGPTIIVQELGEGTPFRKFVRDHANDPEARRRAAVNLFEFFNESLVVLGLFHADPHPGNILVRPDGGITVLDYGCVRSSPVSSRDLSRRTLMHALQDSRDALTAEFAAHPTFRNQPAETVAFSMNVLWPVFQVHAEPFDPRHADPVGGSVFSAEWLQRCHASMSSSKMCEVSGPPDMLFKHRLTHGLNCMMVDLSPPGTRGFWKDVARRYADPTSVVPPRQVRNAAHHNVFPPPHAVCQGPEAADADPTGAFGLDIEARYELGRALRAGIGAAFADDES